MASEVQHQLNIETAGALPEFEQLMELAKETMLQDPLTYERHFQRLLEQEESEPATHRLGVWGARKALDIANGAACYPDPVFYEKEGVGDLLLPVDRRTQLQIEALGSALLEEAFVCLGEDAPQKVEEFKAAGSIEEQVDVCNWLLQRIRAIRESTVENEEVSEETEDENEEETNDSADEDIPRNFYHPARLSPKFIGKYPDVKLEPTCLGYSILLASFFEKTGIPYMHTGVISSAKKDAKRAQLFILLGIMDTASQWGIEIPSYLEDSFSSTISELKESVYGDDGYHAALLVRLGTNDREFSWAQLDPNYEANVRLGSIDNGDVENAHRLLRSTASSSKGLEAHINHLATVVSLRYCVDLQHIIERSPPVEEIDRFLQEVSKEEAMADILETYFKDFFNPYGDDEFRVAHLQATIGEGSIQMYLSNPEQYLQARIQRVLLSYVFPDHDKGDISKCIARCKQDPSYRQRRAEDLKMAPLYAILGLQSYYGKSIMDNYVGYVVHSTYEAGSPAYRVGATVLSDLAVYCGDELPLSFWMSYWPSPVSFSEHSNQVKTPAQVALARQVAKHFGTFSLTYPAVDEIVDRILEQGGPRSEEG